ncbi:OPT/YSL family transporter [Candidatus Bathyarchaeota archaeon]|nr:OPT/YSL family transporter [Candidatus Bathyarchaeota archaeon]
MEEARVRPIIYLAGALLTAIIVVLMEFVALFTVGGTLWGLTGDSWINAWPANMSFVLFWPLVISVLGTLLSRVGVSKHELVIILSMIWVSWLIPSQHGILEIFTMMGTARQIPAFHRWNLEYLKPAHWQWGPDPFNDKLWESWMYGGPVPWAEWMPALLFHTARLIPYYLMFAFFATLWRRQWIDIEALPFPHATAAAKLIDMAYEKVDGGTRLFQNVWLWLGLLIGFLAIYPYWAWTLPGLGLTVSMMYPGSLGIDLTPYVIVPCAPMSFNFEAFWIGAAFLVPVKTLFSYIVTSVVFFWVWWPMMSWLGYWEPQSAGTSGLGYQHSNMFRGWMGPNMQRWVLTWGAVSFISFGAAYAIIFAPIFISFRGELVNSVKALLGRAPSEIEAREPLRYRWQLLALIFFMTISVALWWYASLGNLPVVWGFINYIMYALWLMCRARVAGEYGLVLDFMNDNYWAHNWTYTFRQWFVADPMSPFFIRNVQSRYLVLRSDYPWYFTVIRAAPAATLLESYKIASLEGLHSKHILIATVIAIIVGITVAAFAFLPLWCSFGALNLSAFNYTGAPHNYYQRAPTYACITEVGEYWRGSLGGGGPRASQWILFSIGAAIVSIVYALHAKYPWFPLNPGGVALGFGMLIPNVLVPSMVAYVAKIVVMRIGGAKLYEDVAMPFAIGMAAATGPAVILGFIYQVSTTLSIM